MNQALVQDVVAEVMKRLGDRRPSSGGVRAGETARAEEPKRREAMAHPHRVDVSIGKHGIFANVDAAVDAASDAQKKLVRLNLDERDQIVKLIKSLAKSNAQSWGKMELDETRI